MVFSYPSASLPIISHPKMTQTRHISDYRLCFFYSHILPYVFCPKEDAKEMTGIVTDYKPLTISTK